MTFQLCENCGDKTGLPAKASFDESRHDETGYGPYCETCFAEIAPLNDVAVRRLERIVQLGKDNAALLEALEVLRADFCQQNCSKLNGEHFEECEDATAAIEQARS